jgi:hypothetical protein
MLPAIGVPIFAVVFLVVTGVLGYLIDRSA